MKNLFILIFSFGSLFGKAQITGKITTADTKPLKNATISILQQKDSTVVKLGATNKDGIYSLDFEKAGTYILKVNAIGFTTTYTSISYDSKNLEQPLLQLQKSNKNLKEVSVVAKKPYIEMKADRTVVNVENSINNTGSNALEILQKSPGVMVDNNDKITLKGKQGVLIYIDGKQSYLDEASITALLKNTQSANIEAIELITNPGAKYDAEGNAGIINIKLKKSKKRGTNGSISSGLNFGITPKANLSTTLNHNTGNLNVFGTYGLNGGKNKNRNNFERTQSGRLYNQTASQTDNDITNAIKVGADYNLNSRNTIGVLVNTNISEGVFLGTSNALIGDVGNAIDSKLLADNRIYGRNINANFNGNYKFADTNGTSLNIDLDYGIYDRISNSNQPNRYTDVNDIVTKYVQFKNNTPTKIDIKTAKVDYERKLGKGTLGFGGKVAFINTRNDNKFYDVVSNTDVLNIDRSNHFDYLENVNALYTNYNIQLSKKINTNVGLRMENTHSDGTLTSDKPGGNSKVPRDYTDFFPSASLSYNLNAKHTLSLSYSRRIDRPDYQALNPFEMKLDELTFQKGNAFLKPQYTNTVELGHSFMQFINTSFSYSRITDMYAQVVEQATSNSAFLTQKNLASSNSYNFSIGAPLPIKKWWMGYMNFGASLTDITADISTDVINIVYPSFNGYMEHNITLPKSMNASISGWWAAPGYWGGTFKSKPMGNVDMGVSKNFYNKKLNVKVTVTDVLHTNHWYGTTTLNGLRIVANGGYESQQLRLACTYRFGSSNVNIRQRNTGLESEANRVKK